MLISFDIDDTLMMHGDGYPLDKNRVPWLLRSIFRERLRNGSFDLFKVIQKKGHSIGVYTTSSRKLWYLRWWFKFYGVDLKIIVNQEVHSRVVTASRGSRAPSKNPSKFGIDLHIDDLEGVAIEGERFGFRVLVVDTSDESWAIKIQSLL